VTAVGSARLLGLRVLGFKSFAERTVVEFGAGISAVVGPNGSGKSNLADALRWTLGEQGRSLRTRKSEDVIFAGSEKRAALGMADVTLLLDNSDSLLPVEYSVLELGRRLYRSGEGDYLLNRQRVRLKDLIELLDAAHLADNAFLFIGQGMVDQALALRPEERRPLFEEVAGVRRHDRRRRKAEEQLAEAEDNLARVEDILAELRPQARRLAAQAEQQATRQSAGHELAAALLLAAHARWHEAAGRVAAAAGRLVAARAEADAALTELGEAEATAGAMAGELEARAELERERRVAFESTREELTAVQLREVRIGGDLDSLDGERQRSEAECEAAAASLESRRRELASPTPQPDAGLEDALRGADRALAEAVAELAAMRAARDEQGEQHALIRAQAARAHEVEATGRRASEARQRAIEQRAAAEAARKTADELATDLALVDASALELRQAEAQAVAAQQESVGSLAVAEAEARQAEERLGGVQARLATSAGALDGLRARLAEEEARGIARAARRRGGRRLDDGLEVDPVLRAAIEAVLGDVSRAYFVEQEAVGELARERGILALPLPASLTTDRASRTTGGGGREQTLLDRVVVLGGGRLAEAVRRDPTGAVGRLLETVVWLPDLSSALEAQPLLPLGWLAVTRDARAVLGSITVSLGGADGSLERRAEQNRVAAEVARLESQAHEHESAAATARAALASAREQAVRTRAEAAAGSNERARAEANQRVAAREAEAAARELAWQAAQADRLEDEARRLAGELVALDGPEPEGSKPPESELSPGSRGSGGQGEDALRAWQARVGELRARRDRFARELAEQDRARHEAENRAAEALAGARFDEARMSETDQRLAAILERSQILRGQHEQIQLELATLSARLDEARGELDALLSADATDRGRLAGAERVAAVARERLRRGEDQLRRAEVADLEARLGHDAIREQVLVELAGLGDLGLHALRQGIAAPDAREDAITRHVEDGPDQQDEQRDEAAALETALSLVVPRWEREPPEAEAPSPGRLTTLRRRYHELGAANPFAVDEYQELKARLDSLESQREDLSAAIDRTRSLIDDLSGLIADRFQSTFRALETAFDARFRQLFGGGFARLALTDPEDLSSTGVEIVARPPGKKTQALAMLSGGERALTAVALLFAMLEVRPVPFCVLDEVDAALDEANIGRFTDALRSLAGATQFIVITHNRGTIEAADALYGVTVGDDSVSRVISLRLDEATALATAGRAASPIGSKAPTPVASA
jgi:chromosome segregation protein